MRSLTGLSASLLGLTLALTACGSSSSPTTGSTLQAQSIAAGDNTLSYETPVSATNGYGPYEVNTENGEAAAGDGKPLILNGVTYATGLGTHANADLTFDVGAQCQRFTAQVGVDDSQGANGSVVFQVYVDGIKRFDSGTMTNSSATQAVDVDISGAERLRLVVTDAGDGASYDHADWADTKLRSCITYAAPLTITSGGTYSGNWKSTDPSVAAVTVRTSDPVTIQNSFLAGRGVLVQSKADHSKVTVQNTRAYGLNPNVSGKFKGRFFDAYKIDSLTVQNNLLKGTGGVYMSGGLDTFTDLVTPTSIKIKNNRVINIDGRASTGPYTYSTTNAEGDFTRYQFVMFNKVQKIPNAEIAWNEVINEPYNSRVEDNINMYLSSGTASTPVRIHDNFIQGAYAANPTLDGTATQYSGGGILIGDGNAPAANVGAFIQATDNQVVNTGNYGVGILNGHDNLLQRNRVVSAGRLQSTGANMSTSYAAGLSLYNSSNADNTVFFNNVAKDNVLGLSRYENGAWVRSDNYSPGCARNADGTTKCTNNTSYSGTLDSAAERGEYTSWQAKLTQNSIVIGPTP